MSNIDMDELQLDVEDDDVVDEEQQAIKPEQTSSTPVAPSSSSPIPTHRFSKRQRISRFSFSSCKGDDYYDIDDIDLD